MYKKVFNKKEINDLFNVSLINLIYSLIDKAVFFVLIYISSITISEDIYTRLVIYWGSLQLLGAIGGAPINLLSINGNINTYKDLKRQDVFFITIVFSLMFYLLFFDQEITYILIAIFGSIAIVLKAFFYGKVFRERPIYLIYLSLVKVILFVIVLFFIQGFNTLSSYLMILLSFVILDAFLSYVFSVKIYSPNDKKSTRRINHALFYSLSSSLSMQAGQLLVLKVIHIYYPTFSSLSAIIYQSRSILLALPSSFSSSIVRSISRGELSYRRQYNKKVIFIGGVIAIFSVALSYLLVYFNSSINISNDLEFILFAGISGLIFIHSIYNSILFASEKYRTSSLFSIFIALSSIATLFVTDVLYINFILFYLISLLVFYRVKL